MVTVADLKAAEAQLPKNGHIPLLVCGTCGDECSAHPGDYWSLPLTHVFTCCDKKMSLVTKHTIYRRVKLTHGG